MKSKSPKKVGFFGVCLVCFFGDLWCGWFFLCLRWKKASAAKVLDGFANVFQFKMVFWLMLYLHYRYYRCHLQKLKKSTLIHTTDHFHCHYINTSKLAYAPLPPRISNNTTLNEENKKQKQQNKQKTKIKNNTYKQQQKNTHNKDKVLPPPPVPAGSSVTNKLHRHVLHGLRIWLPLVRFFFSLGFSKVCPVF